MDDEVLLIEDDRDIREDLAALLESEGYKVTQASNGQDALERLKGRAAPCIILLDLMMPVMNGWEFLRKYKCESPVTQVPVVIMSAARDASDVAGKLGAQAFLSKPFEIETILAVVGRVASEASHSGSGDST